MTCSVRFVPSHFVPGRRADSYVCHVCGLEEDRYQLREMPDGKVRRVDCVTDPCHRCLKKFLDTVDKGVSTG